MNIKPMRFLYISSSQRYPQESCCPAFLLHILNEHLLLLKHAGVYTLFLWVLSGTYTRMQSFPIPKVIYPFDLLGRCFRQPSCCCRDASTAVAEQCCFLYLTDQLQSLWFTNNFFWSLCKTVRAKISMTQFTFIKSVTVP